MWILVNGKEATEISNKVVENLLNIYPEENLKATRPAFVEAFNQNWIELNVLKDECDKLLTPWQMFLLDEINLGKHIKHIENQRKHKISGKLVAKRKGAGNVTSKRIIDRLIRLQNFLIAGSNLPVNKFVSSLSLLPTLDAANMTLAHFEIDREKLWGYTTKKSALEYLIKQVQDKNINVCRGVLTNKLLPTHQVVVNSVYKNTSGFVIKDEKIPFIFLPSEISDETEGRQIYTLIYLLVIIGLNKFDYYFEKNFSFKKLKNKSPEFFFHSVASELLMPSVELEKLRGQKVTISLRDELCQKFKVTPTALIFTLKLRQIITQQECQGLEPDTYQPIEKKGHPKHPKMKTSVEKFCGGLCYDAIRTAVQTQSVAPTQLQYLIYGGIYKVGFKKLRSELGV